ncbi:hypothetical protein J5N97_028081 [Dioscorea zingiberensis]|uniref:Integrase catalytic domain-containing protein n=1 Tax=Dioscorea zingiberensis TaxID=325984 RepID=A0A9D5H4J9_9LILI|nr:hypothetical protein J5N97_028081 [Dioscorea zingiberensis]
MSFSTSNSTSTTIASLSSSPGLLPTPSFNHLINVKLNRDNYLLWKAQFMPYLRSQQLLGYVDGTIVCPSKTITEATSTGAAQVPNPAYQTWFQQDQLVLSALLSLLSEEVLTHVLFLSTSFEVWSTLEHMFSSRSRARIMQIRLQLSTLQKKDLSVTDYFHRVKNLADTLSAIGQPLQEEEIISYMLAGLGSDYDPLVTSVTTRTDTISLNDVYAHLMSYELRMEHHNTSFQIPVTGSAANVATRNNNRGGSGSRSRGRGRGRSTPNRGVFSSRGISNFPRSNTRPVCQICGKIGHDALRCYQRFDHSYQPEDTHLAALATTPSYPIDPNWYTDTGATDHITSDLDRLTTRERYTGFDQVQVASGSGLSITHVGHYKIHTPTQSLLLKNVLCVPHITKNLLSVHKFAKDNNVFFEFHPDYFLVKDQASKKSLLHGRCEGGLYPITPAHIAQLKTALISEKPSQDQWHRRLGHPSHSVVQTVLHSHKLPFSVDKTVHVCDACQQAKSHQLPYSTSTHMSSSPLELVFSDVWGPASHSVGGYKYYVSFIDDFSKFTWLYLLNSKSDVERVFFQFQNHVERLLEKKIQCMQTDWGGEYQKLHKFFKNLGIEHRISCPYTHQ